jgi:hypothetical protein
MPGIRGLLTFVLASAVLVLVACGGDDTTSSTSTSATTAGGDCDAIEEVDVGPVAHADTDFQADDYPTNPPAGGDHNDPATAASRVYTDPQPFGETVHLLEHGAVIGWTNNLSAADQTAVEDGFNEVIQDGYYQVAVVENPDLDVPFALSAWGALQKCATVDTAAITAFVEEWYASPKTPEGGLACAGDARTLPNC